MKLILILCNVVPQMNRIEWESERNETKRKTQTMRVDFTSLKHDTEMNFFFSNGGFFSQVDVDVDMDVDMNVDVDVRMHTQIFTTFC